MISLYYGLHSNYFQNEKLRLRRSKSIPQNKKIYFIMAYKINNKHELIFDVDSKIYNLEA